MIAHREAVRFVADANEGSKVGFFGNSAYDVVSLALGAFCESYDWYPVPEEFDRARRGARLRQSPVHKDELGQAPRVLETARKHLSKHRDVI